MKRLTITAFLALCALTNDATAQQCTQAEADALMAFTVDQTIERMLQERMELLAALRDMNDLLLIAVRGLEVQSGEEPEKADILEKVEWLSERIAEQVEAYDEFLTRETP